MAQYARAKQEVINFLRNAPKETDKLYTFSLPLQTEKEAKSFIHRMRVELSRLREKILIEGKQLKPFKMLIHEIENTEIQNKTLITLRYHDSNCSKAVEDVNDLFNILSTGADTVDEEEVRGTKQTLNL